MENMILFPKILKMKKNCLLLSEIPTLITVHAFLEVSVSGNINKTVELLEEESWRADQMCVKQRKTLNNMQNEDDNDPFCAKKICAQEYRSQYNRTWLISLVRTGSALCYTKHQNEHFYI